MDNELNRLPFWQVKSTHKAINPLKNAHYWPEKEGLTIEKIIRLSGTGFAYFIRRMKKFGLPEAKDAWQSSS